MSNWAIYVASYLLVGIALCEIGAAGYRKRGKPMGRWLYLMGIIIWPVLVVIACRPRSNK